MCKRMVHRTNDLTAEYDTKCRHQVRIADRDRDWYAKGMRSDFPGCFDVKRHTIGDEYAPYFMVSIDFVLAVVL